jgi:hypothetical protein
MTGKPCELLRFGIIKGRRFVSVENRRRLVMIIGTAALYESRAGEGRPSSKTRGWAAKDLLAVERTSLGGDARGIRS